MYKGICSAGDRVIHMTKPLEEQLENMVTGKECWVKMEEEEQF